jgi:hypothetical protein
VGETNTSRLVGFDFEKAATGAAAGVGITVVDAFRVFMFDTVGAMAAGVALHDAAHFGVSEFLDVEKGVVHV